MCGLHMRMRYNYTFHNMVKKFDIFLGESLNQHLDDVKYELTRYHLTADSQTSFSRYRYIT